MDIHFIFIIVIVVLLVVVLFVNMYMNNGTPPPKSLRSKRQMRKLKPQQEELTNFYPGDDGESLNWQEKLAEQLDPKIKIANKDFIENVKRFGGSSVRNYEIEELATNAAFTNFQGLKGRPVYIPIRASNREQPSFNTDILKTTRRHLI